MADSSSDRESVDPPSTAGADPNKPYIHGYHASVLRSHASRTARNSCPHLVPHLRRGMRVLDVGCGPGTISADLAALVAGPASLPPSSSSITNTNPPITPPGHVTAIDSSPTVLAAARAHASTALDPAVSKALSFAEADVCALPFADGAFDVVHANQVIQHVRDPVAAVREMRRVARPDGGIIALREGDTHAWFCPTAPPPPEGERSEGVQDTSDVLDAWYSLWRRMARDAGVEPLAGRRLLAYALAAGFDASEIVHAGSGSQAWRAGGGGSGNSGDAGELREWCGMWADRVVLSEFADNAVRGGYETKEGLERMSKAWRQLAETEGAWYAMMQGELVAMRGYGAGS